jgi:hypothetical protein
VESEHTHNNARVCLSFIDFAAQNLSLYSASMCPMSDIPEISRAAAYLNTIIRASYSFYRNTLENVGHIRGRSTHMIGTRYGLCNVCGNTCWTFKVAGSSSDKSTKHTMQRLSALSKLICLTALLPLVVAQSPAWGQCKLTVSPRCHYSLLIFERRW